VSTVAARGTVEMLSAPERVKVSTDGPSQPLSPPTRKLGPPLALTGGQEGIMMELSQQ
jgi:hypothetical protein